MLRFGSASSTRVSVVVDRVANGDVDLYVDADRNLRIDDRDLAAAGPGGDGAGENLASSAGGRLVEGETVRVVPRNVVFRLGASGQTLAFATEGYLEGSAVLGQGSRTKAFGAKGGWGREWVFVRREDGLFLDLNDDGKFDLRAEFLFATVLTIEGYDTSSGPTSWGQGLHSSQWMEPGGSG